MICPKCKKENKGNSKFCGYCGTKFVVKTSSIIAEPVCQTKTTPAPVKPTQEPVITHTVSSASSAPIAKCPKCGSTSLQAGKKGVSVGKAAAGALIVGPLGLLAGGIGMNNTKIICLNCGHKFEPQK